MKKLLLLCLIMFIATMAWSQEEESGYSIKTSASSSVATKYIWRGFNVVDDINIQNNVSLLVGGIEIGYSGVQNWDSENDYQEHDLFASYTYKTEALDISGGYTYYKYASAGDNESHELFIGAKLNKVFLTPSITAYFDIGDVEDGGGEGEYYVLSLEKSFIINGDLIVSLGADLGYNNELYIDEKGFADLNPMASLSYKVNDNVNIGVKALYSMIIDDDVESAMGADEDGEMVGLISINILA